MDEGDLAELRDNQTLVLQNEEVDVAGSYAGNLDSKSLDEQEYAQPIFVVIHLIFFVGRYRWHWRRPWSQHPKNPLLQNF